MNDEIINNSPVATTPQKRELKPIEMVRHDLEKMIPQFSMVLPKHITPERMLRIALTACQQTPKLLNCDRKSLYSAIMRAAQLGLEPDGILGQAYLIPYGTTVQFIPGYKGLIDLARRSGEVSNIIAREVCEHDEFTVDFSQEIPFTHKPLLTGNRGEVTHFWALARFKDGGFHWDYLSRSEIETIRDQSSGWQSAKKFNKTADSPWQKHFNEMGKKTAIRRIAKYLPMSVQKANMVNDLIDAGKKFEFNEFDEVVVLDNGTTIAEDDVEEIKAATKTEDVKNKLKKQDKAKAAGADPQTGEIPQKSASNDAEKTDTTPSNDATKQEVKPTVPEVKQGGFSSKQIPMRGKPDDATQPDYEAWCNIWGSTVALASNEEQLMALHKSNQHLLTQMQSRDAGAFQRCMDDFNAQRELLADQEGGAA